VDISTLRGPHELQAVLRYPDPADAAKSLEKKFVYNLVGDTYISGENRGLAICRR
jgi:hypothetical protein